MPVNEIGKGHSLNKTRDKLTLKLASWNVRVVVTWASVQSRVQQLNSASVKCCYGYITNSKLKPLYKNECLSFSQTLGYFDI